MRRSTLTMKSALEDAGADKLLARMREQKTIHIDPALPPPVAKDQRQEHFFVVKDGSGIAALRYWLQQRKFNTFITTKDARGQDLFGLIWDYELGRQPSGKRSERGLILIADKTFLKKAALTILNYMSTESEYGQQWQHAQRDLWKYGKDGD